MFRLPVLMRQPDAKILPDLSRLRVLVVDDMECVRKVIAGLLRVAGVDRICTAHAIEDAWRKITAFRPDLLITDWQLNGEAGLDLVREVRLSANSPNVFMAIMVISSFAEEHRLRRAAAEGATCYLTKPFTAEQFFAKLKFCVEDRREFECRADYFGPSRAHKAHLGAPAIS